MVGIPPTVDTDAEDVAWALQTASSLWSKNERVDAIVWLRRAAQAAGDAEQDERAFVLAREAVELSEWIASNPLPLPPSSTPEIPIEVGSQVSMSAMTEPVAFAPVKLPPVVPPPQPSQPEVFQSVTREPDSGKVRSAEETHAGLLDPWAATPDEPPLPPTPSPSPPPPPVPTAAPQVGQTAVKIVSGDDYDDEVVTSAHLEVPPAEPALLMTVPKVSFPVEQTLVSAGIVPPVRVSLAEVTALADLPDDARAELERLATIHHLAKDEEVMGFALAYVMDGDVDVEAQIADVPADRIAKGTVLKSRGTVAESVPLRLVGASDESVVATWEADQIEPAFKACPWVEDDLRAQANRMQALVGITLGPLADRLDATLRAQITSRLELRELAEGDVIVEAGEPVRDLCLVGQGSIELVTNGEVTGQVGVGEFLFASEIMSAGKAHATARVGKGGALVLASDRAVAQELMSTCPPLIEIFSG